MAAPTATMVSGALRDRLYHPWRGGQGPATMQKHPHAELRAFLSQGQEFFIAQDGALAAAAVSE
jgi:hypothetical protein